MTGCGRDPIASFEIPSPRITSESERLRNHAPRSPCQTTTPGVPPDSHPSPPRFSLLPEVCSCALWQLYEHPAFRRAAECLSSLPSFAGKPKCLVKSVPESREPEAPHFALSSPDGPLGCCSCRRGFRQVREKFVPLRQDRRFMTVLDARIAAIWQQPLEARSPALNPVFSPGSHQSRNGTTHP